MNRRQRNRNRTTAAILSALVSMKAAGHNICMNCGKHGWHWVQTYPRSLQDIVLGRPDEGFWTCFDN